MVLEEYITDKGLPLMFTEERSWCFGEIKIGFDRIFGATYSWEIGYCWIPINRRTETGDGSSVMELVEQKQRLVVVVLEFVIHCLGLEDLLSKSDSKNNNV